MKKNRARDKGKRGGKNAVRKSGGQTRVQRRILLGETGGENKGETTERGRSEFFLVSGASGEKLERMVRQM